MTRSVGVEWGRAKSLVMPAAIGNNNSIRRIARGARIDRVLVCSNVCTASSMRLVPVRAVAHIDDQRRFERRHAGHQPR